MGRSSDSTFSQLWNSHKICYLSWRLFNNNAYVELFYKVHIYIYIYIRIISTKNFSKLSATNTAHKIQRKKKLSQWNQLISTTDSSFFPQHENNSLIKKSACTCFRIHACTQQFKPPGTIQLIPRVSFSSFSRSLFLLPQHLITVAKKKKPSPPLQKSRDLEPRQVSIKSSLLSAKQSCLYTHTHTHRHWLTYIYIIRRKGKISCGRAARARERAKGARAREKTGRVF